MPLFEFVCKKCKKDFEALVFNEQEEKELKCKLCGSKNIKKRMSVFNFEINGFSAANNYNGKKE